MEDNNNIEKVRTYLLDTFLTLVICVIAIFAAVKFQEVDKPESSLLILNPAVFVLIAISGIRGIGLLFGLRNKKETIAAIVSEYKEKFSSVPSALTTIFTPAVRFGICIFAYIGFLYAGLFRHTLYFYIVSFFFLLVVPYAVSGRKQDLSFVKWLLISFAIAVGLYVIFNNVLQIYFYF